MNPANQFVYLDANATTAVAPEVRRAISAALMEPANAGAAHAFGGRAREVVEKARFQLASLLGAAPSEVVFTSGATEANTLAIEGVVAASAGVRSRRPKVVSVAWEHHAVLEPLGRLRRLGWDVVLVDVDREGAPCLDQLDAAIDEATLLVSVMAANNETGVLAPLREVSRLCAERGALLHTDATQAAAWGDVDVDDLGVDLLSLSAHKMHGPQGVGALYVSREVRRRSGIAPLVPGGGQESGLRGGTVNVPGVAGLGAAASLVTKGTTERSATARALRGRLEHDLLAAHPGAWVNGGSSTRLPGTLNICFPGFPAEAVLAGAPFLAASAGSACRAGAPEPSHVLLAMGRDAAEARSSLRFSLGHTSTEADVDAVVEAIAPCVERARAARA